MPARIACVGNSHGGRLSRCGFSTISVWSVFLSVLSTRNKRPSSGISAKPAMPVFTTLSVVCAKPAITAVLTDKAGKELTVRISKPKGDFAYAQSSNSPALYKVKKQIVDDLNLKPADAAL